MTHDESCEYCYGQGFFEEDYGGGDIREIKCPVLKAEQEEAKGERQFEEARGN